MLFRSVHIKASVSYIMCEAVIFKLSIHDDDLTNHGKLTDICARVIHQAKSVSETLIVVVDCSCKQIKTLESILGLIYGCARLAKFGGNTEVYFEGLWNESEVRKEYPEVQDADEAIDLQITIDSLKKELSIFVKSFTEESSLISAEVMVKESKRACIGGTFDNIHFGHKVIYIKHRYSSASVH